MENQEVVAWKSYPLTIAQERDWLAWLEAGEPGITQWFLINSKNLEEPIRERVPRTKKIVIPDAPIPLVSLPSSLRLILLSLWKTPEQTAEQIVKDTGLGKSTVFNYLRRAREYGYNVTYRSNHQQHANSLRTYTLQTPKPQEATHE